MKGGSPMANRILTAEGWEQRIRDKMGIDIAYLPNSAVQQPEIITVAEANIIKQVPDYASLADDNLVYLEAAVVSECAALLCPSMPSRLPKKEQGPHETHELDVDWSKMKTDFEIERDGYIGNISTVTITSFSHFNLSTPTRAWEEEW
jgi:hypothetical protein